MYIFITIIILLASLLMIFAVLIQKSKGGGLASGFSSSNQIMGVRKTTDFLEKFTWTLAGVIIVLSILTAKYTVRSSTQPQSDIDIQQPAPIAPSATPDVTPTLPLPQAPDQDATENQQPTE